MDVQRRLGNCHLRTDEDIEIFEAEEVAAQWAAEAAAARVRVLSSRSIFEIECISGIEIIWPTFQLRGRLEALTGSV